MIKSDGPEHIHHKAGSIGSGHLHDAPAYFAAIAQTLNDYREILVVGPAETRTEFQTYLAGHSPAIAKRVLGIEPMAQASEGEIIDHARRFFIRADRMTLQH